MFWRTVKIIKSTQGEVPGHRDGHCFLNKKKINIFFWKVCRSEINKERWKTLDKQNEAFRENKKIIVL